MNKQIFASELMARVWKLARFLIIVGLSFILLYPILYMISMSVRSADQVADPSVIWIPKVYTFDNFVSAVKYMEYDASFHTSMTVSLTSSVLSLISCSLAGYGLARFKFRGNLVYFCYHDAYCTGPGCYNSDVLTVSELFDSDYFTNNEYRIRNSDAIMAFRKPY